MKNLCSMTSTGKAKSDNSKLQILLEYLHDENFLGEGYIFHSVEEGQLNGHVISKH